MKIVGNKNFECETCEIGEMPKSFSRKLNAKASKPLQLIHSDLAGPVGPLSRVGYKYVMNFVDDYSNCSFVYFLNEKSNACMGLEKFPADVSP